MAEAVFAKAAFLQSFIAAGPGFGCRASSAFVRCARFSAVVFRNGFETMEQVRHQALLEAACAGDTGAIERLLAACQPELRRYAQRNCLISDVDDAIQESLLILSRHVSSLRAVAAFSSWVFSIVRRECHRMARKSLAMDPWDDERADAWFAAMPTDDLRCDIAAALESLPEHYREVIVLRDLNEMTIGEIAEQLGETSTAVKSRLHRARQLTRDYLLG
jgi:RNA polymerase sigma factor (sigma-70 family)